MGAEPVEAPDETCFLALMGRTPPGGVGSAIGRRLLREPPQILEGIDARRVTVAPHELQRVAAHVLDLQGIHVWVDHLRHEHAPTRHLVHATCAGTVYAQVPGCVLGHRSVLPADPEAGAVLGGTDVLREVAGLGAHAAGPPLVGPERRSEGSQRSPSLSASARNAAPRWLRAFFSSGVSSANVRSRP